ncbi:MAG: hypothetical protein WC365_06900 [Candidatus Babeliales bacterium]|jgi:hypothetical protein
MSIQLEVSTPYHAVAVQNLQMRNITPGQLESFLTEVANADMQVLLDYLSKHIVTGETIGSIRMRLLERSNDKVSVAVGTQSRGSQLRWLDRGRGEVRPVNRKFLRYIAHPSGVIIFSRYSRATQPSNIMQTAATTALAKAPEIAQRIIAMPQGVA